MCRIAERKTHILHQTRPCSVLIFAAKNNLSYAVEKTKIQIKLPAVCFREKYKNETKTKKNYACTRPDRILSPLMSRIDLVSKNLLANYSRNCRNRDNCSNNYDKLIDKYRKNRKNNKSNKIQDLGKEEAKKGLEMCADVAKIAKVTRILLPN